MNIDLFKNIITRPERYFPSIAFYYLLDKTNEWVYLILLIISFIFGIFNDRITDYFKMLVFKKAKKLVANKKEDSALKYIVKKISPIIRKQVFSFSLIGTIMILLNIIPFFGLFKLIEYKTSLFLIIIGISFLFLKLIEFIIKLIDYLIHNWKRIIQIR